MLYLVISLVALALGPALAWVALRSRDITFLLDGFVIATITGLVVIHLVPHSLAIVGPTAVAAALVGFLGPGLIERYLRGVARQAHRATVALAISGLAVHALADGVALALPHAHDEASLLSMAVLIHRLPVAITIWWLLSASRGRALAAVALLAIGVATVIGFSAGERVSAAVDTQFFALFQALVAGSLMHVIFHQPVLERDEGSEAGNRTRSGVGALLGMLLVIWLADAHLLPKASADSIDFGHTFMTLLLEVAPALILAFGVAGLMQALLPNAPRSWLRTGNPGTEAMRGMVFGLPLPICSCGVVPLYSGLIRQGVPATAGMAFLVATPELGVDAVLISVPLLGVELTLIRVVLAVVIALGVGWVVGAVADRASTTPEPAPAAAPRSFGDRLRDGLGFGFRDIVDDTGPWIVFGLVIAALAEPLIQEDWLRHLPWGADVALFALLGIPLYVCASGATPLAAILIHKGVSPGAALAFLLAGPATNMTTFALLGRLHGRRIALAFGTVIAVLAIALGFGVNALSPALSGMSIHDAAAEEPGWLGYASVVVLALIYAASLMRLGPRGFIAQITSPFGSMSAGHDHDHGHGHGHDHDHAHGHDHAHDRDHGCC